MIRFFSIIAITLIATCVQAQTGDLRSLLNRTIIIAVEQSSINPGSAYRQYDKAKADSLIISSLKEETELNLLAKAFKHYWWLSDNYIFMNSDEVMAELKANPEQYTTLHIGKLVLTKITTYKDGTRTSKSRDIEKLNLSTLSQNIQNINISGYAYTDFVTTLNRLQYAIDYELKGNGTPSPVQSVKDNNGLVTRKVLLLDKNLIQLPIDKIKLAYPIGEVQVTDVETIEQAILQKDANYLYIIQLSTGYKGGAAHMVIDAETGANCLQAYTLEPSLITEKDLRNLVKQYKIYSKK